MPVYSVSTLSTTSSNAFENNRPVLLGNNILESGATSNSVWRTWDHSVLVQDYARVTIDASAGSYGATDLTDYPLTLVSDRRPSKQTQPTLDNYTPASTNDRFAVIFPIESTAKLGMAMNSIAIVNHNLGSITNKYSSVNDVYVDLYIADNSDFTVNVERIFRWTNPTTDKPLVALNLSRKWGSDPVGATYYEEYASSASTATSSYYVQISIHCLNATMGTSGSNILPKIGQVVLGKRTQLLHYPSVPYADRALYTDAEVNDPTTGQVKIYEMSSGCQNFVSDFVLTSDKSNLITFFENYIDYGLKPFLYSVKPRSNWTYGGNSSASTFSTSFPPAHWVHLSEPSFEIVKTNDSPYDYRTTLTMSEIAPYYTSFSI